MTNSNREMLLGMLEIVERGPEVTARFREEIPNRLDASVTDHAIGLMDTVQRWVAERGTEYVRQQITAS